MTFKVGDRVKLVGGWFDSPANPLWGGRSGKVEGIIASCSPSGTLPISVSWNNGQNNSYRSQNLELLNSFKEKVEVYGIVAFCEKYYK